MSRTAAARLRVSCESAATPAGAPAEIAAFAGDLDLATIGEFEETVEEHGDTSLVVDLREVRFIDSTGIHLVVRARQARAERDLGLELVVTPGSAVDRVLAISALREALDPKPDPDAALAALDHGAAR